jgi:hypothetical protein
MRAATGLGYFQPMDAHDQPGAVAARALRYPYAVPSRSFVQVGARTLVPGEVEVDLAQRTAALAYGANAAPEALARKLAGNSEPLPVLRATLSGFDVVYSAHISLYGAVPATLLPSPGTEVDVFVAYPTEDQLRLIRATEPNYELGELSSPCQLESGALAEGLHAFFSRHGSLLVGDSEVALASVAARRRTLPAMSEPEVLEEVKGALCPQLTLSRFVEGCVADPDLARRHTEALRRTPPRSLR